jgi:hypothetical protein
VVRKGGDRGSGVRGRSRLGRFLRQSADAGAVARPGCGIVRSCHAVPPGSASRTSRSRLRRQCPASSPQSFFSRASRPHPAR